MSAATTASSRDSPDSPEDYSAASVTAEDAIEDSAKMRRAEMGKCCRTKDDPSPAREIANHPGSQGRGED